VSTALLLPATILGQAAASGDAAAAGPIGTREFIFLGLWALFTTLYWLTYRRDENPLGAALKVGCLLAFIYGMMFFFDWVAHEVPGNEVITLGISSRPAADVLGPRIPLLSDALFWFVMVLLVLVAWYARKKVSTVGALILSTWDRGHWYMLPVIFVLLTIGLLLVAAAASPVLSPFIYTLF
jgi:hypothetical protein